MRKNIVVGNWKMNLQRKESLDLVGKVISLLENQDVEVVLAPSYTCLYKVNKMCADLSFIQTASQNISKNKKGAFTGEVSAEMIHSMGVKYTILGHSERREYFNESNQDLKSKVNLSISNDLDVIFCCGESIEQRDSDIHFDWIKSQIEESLFHLSEEEFSKIIIAYEPIWAIGTGVTASSFQAEEVHAFIRSLIFDKYGDNVSSNCSILYGGSCNPNNAKELFSKENIDGGLIGGASLEANSFIEIIKSF